MRVLIIDDDAAYLSFCSTVLADDGHDVVTCGTFIEARRQLVQEHFDALIADVRLGAYNGMHLITLAAPSIIRIAMSAFLDTVIRQDAEHMGARFVVKPSDCASVSALLSPGASVVLGQSSENGSPVQTPTPNQPHLSGPGL